jgi:phospholipase/carboxylesterase
MSELLETIEIETAPQPRASVIWMHGLGADGNDFVPIVGELDLAGTPPVRFVFPHAPKRAVTINNGMVMRAWYDVSFGDLEGKSRRPDGVGIHESQDRINALIAREAGRGIAPGNIVLAGFSQGGAIALHTALRQPVPLGGVLALSTYLPLAEMAGREMRPDCRLTPIFMAHGRSDPIVPHRLGLESRDRLAEMGFTVEWHEYPMQHSVCEAELRDIEAWLTLRLQSGQQDAR